MINLTQKVCKHCENPFETKYKSQKFCNSECYGLFIESKKGYPSKGICLNCNNVFKKGNSTQKYCSITCSIEHSQAWNRKLNPDRTVSEMLLRNKWTILEDKVVLVEENHVACNLDKDTLLYELIGDTKLIIGYK